MLLIPFVSWQPDVRRFRNLRYGDGGRGHLLDVYAHRRRPQGAPVLICTCTGERSDREQDAGSAPAALPARKSRLGVRECDQLARASWTDQVIDVKRVIAWVREHGPAYGADPATVILAGGSSGARGRDRGADCWRHTHFQPGFEQVNTSASAVVALYGYYGTTGDAEDTPTSPLAYVHAAAPPFLIIHGTLDTLVLVEDVRHFVDRLTTASGQPVVYAELPGAQHNFDLFHSLRMSSITDAVESFVTDVYRDVTTSHVGRLAAGACRRQDRRTPPLCLHESIARAQLRFDIDGTRRARLASSRVLRRQDRWTR